MSTRTYIDHLIALNKVELTLRGSGPARALRAMLVAERTRLVGELPMALVQHHEELMSRCGQSLVNLGPSGSCGGCGEMLPVAMLAEINQHGRMIVCPGCGRLVAKWPTVDAGEAAARP